MTAHLNVYISDLNSRVYRDALTGVRNKGTFEISVRKFDDQIRAPQPGQKLCFACVMFDCDKLKDINDRFGHEKGDIYLKTACHLICRIFDHSPVYRVGGDEFVTILQNEDYERREELLVAFDLTAEEQNRSTDNPWEKVRISKGLVVYDPAADRSAESVFDRADAAMYEDKKRRRLV